MAARKREHEMDGPDTWELVCYEALATDMKYSSGFVHSLLFFFGFLRFFVISGNVS